MISWSLAGEITSFCVYSTSAYLYFVGLERETLESLKLRDDIHPVILETYDSFGGRYKFLTSLDMILQLFFFSLSAFCSSLALMGLFPKTQAQLNKFLNSFYASVTFPIGVVRAQSFNGVEPS
jgi:hypothetical protein